MAVTIREGDVDDIADAVPLLNTVDRTRVSTVAGARYRLLEAPPEARRNWWAARDKEMLVGWATGGVDHDTTARSGYLSVSVLESYRRRGIGTALLERALSHLGDSTRIQASANESGRGFPERYGFRHTQTRRMSGIDPRTVDTCELDSAEERVASLLEVGPEQTFAVDAESVADQPGDDSIDAVDYEQWLVDHWAFPDYDLGLGRAVVVDGRAVAVTFVIVDRESRRALNAYTGSLRAYRGRGYARLAKLALLRRLAELGFELVLTENDETNAAMLAINERLGYRPIESRYAYLLDR